MWLNEVDMKKKTQNNIVVMFLSNTMQKNINSLAPIMNEWDALQRSKINFSGEGNMYSNCRVIKFILFNKKEISFFIPQISEIGILQLLCKRLCISHC